MKNFKTHSRWIEQITGRAPFELMALAFTCLRINLEIEVGLREVYALERKSKKMDEIIVSLKQASYTRSLLRRVFDIFVMLRLEDEQQSIRYRRQKQQTLEVVERVQNLTKAASSGPRRSS